MSKLGKDEEEKFELAVKSSRSVLEGFLKVVSGDKQSLELFQKTGNLGEAFSDPLRETGFQRARAVRETRLQAMTNPETFSADREIELRKVGDNINSAYYTTFQQYADAGYPSIECKVKALAAAKIAKAQGEESIEARFGTLETKMADVKTIAAAQANHSGFDLSAR